MRGLRLFAGALAFAAVLAGASGAAWAGAGRTIQLGQVAPVSTGMAGAIGSGSLNVYVPGEAGASNVNVQTNIDNSKTIDASNNVSVNDSVNGANAAYGGTGVSPYNFQSNALGVINGVASFNAGITANNGPNFTAVTDALESATFLQSQQSGNQ